MRLFLAGILFTCFSFLISAQTNFNFEEISYTGFEERGNDCWGYVDGSGLEYAIVGSRTKTHIYSLEDPANPIERAVIEGSVSTWRDIKTFGSFIYVIADSGVDGLLIIDMSAAPETINFDFWRPELTMAEVTDTLNMCHNLFIDDEGTCYLAGCRIPERDRRGVIMIDIKTDPWNPAVLGYETNAYAHDVYVQDDRMYTSDIYEGEFSIYDVSDKADPVYLGGAETSSSFTHNVWVSDDGNTVFTTDEVSDAYVDAYDISDLTDIKRLDIHKPAATANQGVIPHNTHFLDDYLITSWYTDGVVITDVSRPDNMIKVGGFDTFEGPNGGFNGCWGVYPYLPSGLIIASSFRNSEDDGNGGFYILRPTYSRAAHLQGIVTNSLDQSPINNVTVAISNGGSLSTFTDPNGEYKTGASSAGDYTIRFTHPEYFPKAVSLELENVNLNELSISLDPKPTVRFEGTVLSESNGLPIADASISLTDGENSYETSADDSGNFELDILVGDYEIVAGKWGFFHDSMNLDFSSDSSALFQLELGYQDDFIFDSQWSITGNASQGVWERGIPFGTFTFNNFAANPDSDYDSDYGNSAMITGNKGSEVDDDDVDNGETVLTSPEMDLSEYLNPKFDFAVWFFDLGSGTPDDSLDVFLSNGTDSIVLYSTRHIGSEWEYIENLSLTGPIELTSSMTVIVKTSDQENSDHVVEAGFDAFKVREGPPLSSSDIENKVLAASPNPFSDEIIIQWDGNEAAEAVLINQIGQMNQSFDLLPGKNAYSVSNSVPSGIYYLVVRSKSNEASHKKLIKL